VVSHDRYFLDRTVDHLLAMEDGKLGPRYPTPYATFIRLQREAAGAQQAVKSADKSAPAKASSRTSRAPKLSWKVSKELQSLEAAIDKLEETRNGIMDEMNACGDDYVRLQSLAAQLADADARLETAMERWMELSELAEEG